jgi:peptidyl-prolyl cis-trans isomerase C
MIPHSTRFALRAAPALATLTLATLTLGLGLAFAQTPAPAPAPNPAPAPAPAPSAAPAAPRPDAVVARVDGLPITEQDLAIAAEDLGQQLPQQLTPAQRRDYLVNYLTDLKLAAKAAAEQKLEDAPDFKSRLAYFRDKVLVDEYLAIEAKKGVSEDAMRKLYDETTKNAAPELEVRARHILVEDEDEAKKIHGRVAGGKEDFAAIAKESSKDPGSGKEGGDLGYFTKDRMVPEFAEAAFKLEPGQVSAPVKSQFGWHVIKLEDKRVKPLPAFEQVRPQIEQYLTRKVHTDLILALRGKGKVERLDKPAEAPATQAVPPAEPKK